MTSAIVPASVDGSISGTLSDGSAVVTTAAVAAAVAVIVVVAAAASSDDICEASTRSTHNTTHSSAAHARCLATHETALRRPQCQRRSKSSDA